MNFQMSQWHTRRYKKMAYVKTSSWWRREICRIIVKQQKGENIRRTKVSKNNLKMRNMRNECWHTILRCSGLAEAKAEASVVIGTGCGLGASIGDSGIPEASSGIGIIGPMNPCGIIWVSTPLRAFCRYLKPWFALRWINYIWHQHFKKKDG